MKRIVLRYRPPCNPPPRHRGFTLIEVLVVVAIIALLIAILLPSLRRAREQSKMLVCQAQIGQLMKSALMYTSESKGRLPGTGINDSPFSSNYNAGTRRDWLTWLGTWQVVVDIKNVGTWPAWPKVPENGRLWKYYNSKDLLKCPSALNYNGKFSYSTPENVSMSLPGAGTGRYRLPPMMEKVKHPAQAIQFLDEDEANGIASYSVDDGFGAGDLFADRHIGKASVAFFDGHAGAYEFPRGKKTAMIQTTEAFTADKIQIAPFNCRYTPEPWKFKGAAKMPKYTRSTDDDKGYGYPPGRCSGTPGCE